MEITQLIRTGVSKAVETLYDHQVGEADVLVSATRKEFEGDYTVVVFPYSRAARKKPNLIGEDLGTYLVENVELIANFNVIKGFLNLSIADVYWSQFVYELSNKDDYG